MTPSFKNEHHVTCDDWYEYAITHRDLKIAHALEWENSIWRKKQSELFL